MICPRCHQPLLSCNCPEAPARIEAFLNSPEGQALPNSTHNTLVRRAAHLIDLRMIGAFPPSPHDIHLRPLTSSTK